MMCELRSLLSCGKGEQKGQPGIVLMAARRIFRILIGMEITTR